MSARDLLLRVAIALGVAKLINDEDDNDNRPRLPEDDAYAMDRLWNAYHDGLRKLASFVVPGRQMPHDWYSLKPIVSFDINTLGTGAIRNDSSRWLLPWYVDGQPLTNFIWSNSSGGRGRFAKTDISEVLAQLAVSGTSTGCPVRGAVIPFQNTNDEGQGVRWELRIAPRPNTTITITAQYRVAMTFNRELDGKHPFGRLCDEAVLAATKYAYVADDAENPKRPSMEMAFKEQAVGAVANDIRYNAPRTLGLMKDAGESGTFHPRFNDPIEAGLYYNGSQVM